MNGSIRLKRRNPRYNVVGMNSVSALSSFDVVLIP